ncbi:acyl-CoA thioesterase [Lacticaseibacillus baoqingensis]|uniref:Acyl-CoA thioesterase n=1 Tax=Lacticaseibacillus baoqingensis TaxID=2486013 RepID=A0ABW4E778_9LACO|nr:acyl-CoA thioesterase [Lacticaseibacillus baoqingensis]
MLKQSLTKSIASHRIFEGQMNEHDSLFGGQTLSWLDESASIAAHRFARRQLVTGSVDSMVYANPVLIGNALIYTRFVTGVGTKSMEVFTKLVGEDLDTGERYLAGYAFSTFVSTTTVPLPSLEYDEAEGQAIAAGYTKRRAINRQRRQEAQLISLD